MSLDYVRETVRERGIEVQHARRELVRRASDDLRDLAFSGASEPYIRDAMRLLNEEPTPEQVRDVVDSLATILTSRMYLAQNMPMPGSWRSPVMTPSEDKPLVVLHRHLEGTAAIAKALDVLSWVVAYDQLAEELPSSGS